MKLLDRYIAKSVSVVAFFTLLLCTLMLLSVDLFSNLDSYLTNEVPALTIIKMTLLYAPEAALFAFGPSLLFSASFFLSQLNANNEYICLLGSGLSYRRIVTPILILGLIFSTFQFIFSEQVQIPASKSRAVAEDSLFGLRSTYDNRNITLRDPNNAFIVHAKQYNESHKRLAQVLLVKMDDDGALRARVDAAWAFWEEDAQIWRLERARIQIISQDQSVVETLEEQEMYLDDFTLEPGYFRNMTQDINTMDIVLARQYLQSVALLNPTAYPPLATDFAKRILDSLNPFILLFIACAISYKYKKNILLFSIITSLGLAVIYYVVQMVTLIMAKQGVIAPHWGMVIPMIVIVCIALAERTVVS